MDVPAHEELLPRLRHLARSRYGRIRLGRPDDKPEFGRFAWFTMLFQAGIGMVSWAVSEPVTHYADPHLAKPETPDVASLALQTAFFHWGLPPWAIYAVVGLAVAYQIMARDQNGEKRQMQEIMRRHEAGEPVGPTTSSNSSK